MAGYSLIVRDPTWRDATDTGQDEAEDTERSTTALFTTSDARPGFSSELFTRLPGELYVAGLNPPALPLPDLPDEADVDPEAIDVLRKTARELIVSRRQQRSSTDSKTVIPADATEATPDEPEELRRALCFRPVTARGTPVVARIPDDRLGPPGSVRTRPGADGGVFVAAGHGPWGISLSLGTGMVMAEMVQGRPLSADVGLLGLK